MRMRLVLASGGQDSTYLSGMGQGKFDGQGYQFLLQSETFCGWSRLIASAGCLIFHKDRLISHS
jgi:hypothetical protein